MTGVAAAQETPSGLVVARDPDALEGALEAARESASARWEGQLVSPPARGEAPAPTAALDAYFEGEYVSCLEESARPALQVERLLADGHRRVAGVVLAVRAACLERLHESERSRAVLRQLLVQELVTDEVDALLRGDLHQLLEGLRSELDEEPRVRVRVRSEPAGARVIVDGGSLSCDATPCVLLLRRGAHHFRVERPGWRRERGMRTLDAELASLDFSLGRPSMEESRTALSGTLAAEPEVTPDLLRDVSQAWGRRLVLSVWRREGAVAAALYDRSRDAMVTGVEPDGPGAVGLAVDQAIREWTGAGAPPVWPWIVGGGAALVVLTVVAVVLGVSLQPEPEPQWVVRFPG